MLFWVFNNAEKNPSKNVMEGEMRWNLTLTNHALKMASDC